MNKPAQTKRLILLGPPGAGKGTQAHIIAEESGLVQISTGDMLREAIRADDTLGREAAGHVEAGRLVPDALMVALVCQRLQRSDCQNGFILDGFPRTLVQARALSEVAECPNMVLVFHIVDEILVRRLSGRRVHPASGRIYHILFNPPQREGLDDVSGEPLIQRTDDSEETVRERLHIYHAETEPLIHFYSQMAEQDSNFCFFALDAEAAVDEVAAQIRHALATHGTATHSAIA